MSLAGTALLVTALAAAAAAAVLALLRIRGRGARDGVVRVGIVSAAVAVLAAVVLMEVDLLAGLGETAYAARAASVEMPAYYRATSLWAGMEGSLLLWSLAAVAVALAFVLRPSADRTRRVAAGVLAGVVAAAVAVTLVADPFEPLDGAPGASPSALLQDHPAMGIHPPVLYAGFALLAVPFALSLAALVTRTRDTRWRRTTAAWTRAGWVLLTAGIVLGGWWSYAVLGWGGYWAWDPVENASLLPWLAATALLHALHDPGARRVVVLAGLPYLLVLTATFLTRSGVVESVHAFSVSHLGVALGGVLALAVTVWLAAVVAGRAVWRGRSPGLELSRRGVLRLQSVLLLLTAAVVLAGTILPAVVGAIGGTRVALGVPWFERTLAPLAVVLLVLLAVGLEVRSGDRVRDLLGRLALPVAGGALAAGAVAVATRDVALAAAAGVAVVVLIDLVRRIVRRGRRVDRGVLGASLAHAGVAVAAVGVVAGGLGVVAEDTVPLGGTVVAGDSTALLVDLESSEDERRVTGRARVLVTEPGGAAIESRPELRWYRDSGTVVASPDIRSEVWRDVYVTLIALDPAGGTATIRLAVTPLVSLVGFGCTVAIGGAVVAGSARLGRRRAPTRAERTPEAVP